MSGSILIFGGIGLLSAIATAVFLISIRRWAIEADLLDTPNERSSHNTSVPSGGGIAIVVIVILMLTILGLTGLISKTLIVSILPPLALLATVGFIDDFREVSAPVRLGAQILAVSWFLYALGGEFRIGVSIVDESDAVRHVIVLVSMVWLINLFNFMDGIDCLAASEAIYVVVGIAAIVFTFIGQSPLGYIAASIAGACLGFLYWNWPPARVFMGDTGSSSLGFLVGALALHASVATEILVWPWLILLGIFIVDSTFTLIRRLVSGQRWYQAHRSHAYQKLAIRWARHWPVTVAACLVNVGWLYPLAWLSASRPDSGWWLTGLAWFPLVFAAWILGAGKVDSQVIESNQK